MNRSFGKVILLGEHAVVHGEPALAAALDRGLRVLDVRRGEPGLRLVVHGWDLAVSADDDHPVAPALRALAGELRGRFGVAPAARIELEADLPPGSGLGSSAALAVAVTRALGEAAGVHLDDDLVCSIADAAERCFHANPSGIDVALAARGGLGLFRRGEGLRRLETEPIRLAIGLSGESKRTSTMVDRVAEQLRAAPEATGARLRALGDAARAGADALVANDLPTLGRLMSSAHDTLAELGISTAGLDELVGTAVRAGALGAKLTGGGGGGAVIALAPGREDAIVAAWRAVGRDAFVATAGVSR